MARALETAEQFFKIAQFCSATQPFGHCFCPFRESLCQPAFRHRSTRLIAQYPISEGLANDVPKIEELKREVAKWGMGVSTPNEMRQMMGMIADGRAGSPAAVDEMWRVLTHQFKDGGIASQIPPWVSVASKGGKAARTRSDMAVVNSPSGIYVITIFIEGPPDAKSSWHGEADTSIRAISGAVWRHYHPNDKWSPPAGADKFW